MERDAVSRQGFLASGAAFAAAPRAAFAQTSPHITVGVTPIDAGMGPIVCQRAGFYRKYGLDVAVSTNGMGAANAAAIAGGTLQLAGSNVVTLIKAHLKGLPFQIVVPGSLYLSDHAAEVLLVRKDAPIRTGADFNGKTIASSAIGDLMSTTALAWIDQNGGDSKTVKVIELPPNATGTALQAGRIDGAVVAEPRLSEIVRTGTVRVVADNYDVIGRRFLISAYFGMPDFLNANRDAIERYVRAALEGNVYANAHHDETAAWLSDLAHVEVSEVKRTQREVFAETIDPADVQAVIDGAFRIKAIDRTFDAREMFSPIVLNLQR